MCIRDRFLSDDVDLKLKFATELASIYGKRVLLENTPLFNNEILCASYTWWINNSYCIKSPEQIIIPLLPIPRIEEPINALTVSHNRNLSKDWFREFLLPEACLLYTSPSPRDATLSRMPSSA